VRLRVSRRSWSVVGAAFCVCVAALAQGTASLASSGGRDRTAPRAEQVRTYTTKGTLPLQTALLDPFTFTGVQQPTALKMASAAGASYIRLVVPW
jgi:hypothetical protein